AARSLLTGRGLAGRGLSGAALLVRSERAVPAAGTLLLGALHHRGEQASARRLLRSRQCRGAFLDVGGLQEQSLLAYLDQVGRRPVEDEAGREEEPPESEEQRHDPREHLLLLVRSRWARSLHLALLEEGRGDHRRREEVVGDLGGNPLAAIDGSHDRAALVLQLRGGGSRLLGRTHQVHGPQGQAGSGRKIARGDLLVDRQPELAPAREVRRRLRIAQDRVERDEDRQLEEHRPAPGEGVDPRLLVDLHDLLVLLLPVPLVFLLDRLHLRLDRLHVLHRADLLDAERQQDEPGQQREGDDRQAVVRDEVVDAGEEPSDRVEEALPDSDRDHAPFLSGMTASYFRARFRGSGIGSMPPLVKGPQRASLHTASAVPWTAPRDLIAPSAYWEQDG